MLLYNSTPQINPHLTQCNVNPRLCHTYHIHIPIECLWSNTAYHNKFLCQIKSIYQTQRGDEALCGPTPSARGQARVDATVSCHFTSKVISLSILKHSILKYTCICPQIRSLGDRILDSASHWKKSQVKFEREDISRISETHLLEQFR